METKKFSEWGILALLVFGFFGLTHPNLPFGEKDDSFVHVNILNHQDTDLEGATVRFYIYETNAYTSTGRFEVDSNDNAAKLVMFGWQDAEPDYYPVRMALSDEDGKVKVKHAWMWIG